jgi:hypothetical protein
VLTSASVLVKHDVDTKQTMGNIIRSGRRETVEAVANAQVKSERKVIIVGCGDTGELYST